MIIATPVGPLQCTITGAERAQLQLSAGAIAPTLPLGMAIDGCHAVLWRIMVPEDTSNCVITCEWHAAGQEGHPESGEGLDAVTWVADQVAYALGTEDADGLRRRLRAIPRVDGAPTVDEPAVTSFASGLRVHLPSLRAGETVSGHFVLAWTAASNALSAWFAVDVAHATVWNALAAATPSTS